MTIPAFINPTAGNADDARKALSGIPGVEIRETGAASLADEIRSAVERGAHRIIVAGGDGTVATAASIIAGTEVSLAILPAGTLNHLAKDLGIPTDLRAAAELAVSGVITTIDLGRAGERIFVNTSSLGAYVLFVRTRERLERMLPYWLASLTASLRIMFRLRRIRVEMEADAQRSTFATPLVFVGVGERELKLPRLGGRVEGGQRGLHVIVVQTRGAARLMAVGLEAVARGLTSVSRGPAVDAFLVDRCRIELPVATARIAVDGEVVEAHGTLEYSLWRDALKVVVPAAADRG